MFRNLLVLAAIGVAAVGAAPATAKRDTPAVAYQKLLAGKVPGEPVDCIETRFSQPSLSAYGTKLIYRVSRDLVYVSETGGGCSGVARGDALVSQRFQTRQCRGDIATTVDTVARFPTGSCSFGAFTPYRSQ